MNRFSNPDLRRMNARELAALQTEVLKGVAHAAECRRKGEGLLQEINRAKAVRRNL